VRELPRVQGEAGATDAGEGEGLAARGEEMKQSKFLRRREKRERKAAQLREAEARVDAAIDESRGTYTGMLGSKSIFEAPKVRAAMKHRDRILRDLGKISKGRG
jgi:hypothetical protein